MLQKNLNPAVSRNISKPVLNVGLQLHESVDKFVDNVQSIAIICHLNHVEQILATN